MKVTQGVAGMNVKGKGSSYGGMKVVEDGRKRQLAQRLSWKFKRTKVARGGAGAEQSESWGRKGCEGRTVHIIHSAPGTVHNDVFTSLHQFLLTAIYVHHAVIW